MIDQVFEFPLSDEICLSSKDERVCVVAVIGKSDIGNRSCKAIPIDELLKKNVFQGKLCSKVHLDTDLLCNISGFYDDKNNVIYLHLVSVNDSSTLLQTCSFFRHELEEKGFLDIWSDINVSCVGAMFFLFLVSHIVMIVHPRTTFDTSFLHIFKTLDALRQQYNQEIGEVLKEVDGISNEWIQACRPCSPRLLFIFLSNPLGIPELSDSLEHSSHKSKKFPSVKKLEHALEDQIYKLLRKCRIITNISTNCLFAIPANQEFVHIYQSKNIITDPVKFLINQLKTYCQLSATDHQASAPGLISNTYENVQPVSDHLSFNVFIKQHTDLALEKGFDDNVGRSCNVAYFQLPSLRLWLRISSSLFDHIFGDHFESGENLLKSSLKNALDVDVKFSEARCKKVLPVASITYQENLPSLYTSEYHQRKLAHTMKIFSKHARGPAYNYYAEKLLADCEKFWKNGHQLCETLSLTGNNCSNPLHRLDDAEYDISSLPVMEHVSRVKMIAACNCGRSQAPREDPFNIKAANYDFYHMMESECCFNLPEKWNFPVFEPSSPDCKEADIKKPDELPSENIVLDDNSIAFSYVPMTDNVEHNIVSRAETVDALEELSLSVDNTAPRTSSFADQAFKSLDSESPIHAAVRISESYDVDDAKLLVRQPSTTEYLPGMLHSQSPMGLLPLYSYWSLVCLGPSSLYSHNIGIHDQPGFIPGTNFLLPWDVSVKLSNKDKDIRWGEQRRNNVRGKGKIMKDSAEINVKVFLGMEYECPRGHRFMCSAPEKVLKASGSGLIKETANKIVSSDMPLYNNCPCRSNIALVAQLIRIHVVTPKTPVHVLLNPKVQPGPGLCPIFLPGNPSPVKLSQSAYWILRLPFVYQGDDGPVLSPKELKSGMNFGRLLKPACWVVESDDVK